jgi:Ca2+-binding EF-hand superfamily protein
MKSITSILSITALLCASSLSVAAANNDPAMPAHAKAGKQQQMQQRLKEVDSNGDGNISKAEFQANGEKKFAKMDSNGDGQISPDERKQMQQQMQHQRQERKGQPEGDSFP